LRRRSHHHGLDTFAGDLNITSRSAARARRCQIRAAARVFASKVNLCRVLLSRASSWVIGCSLLGMLAGIRVRSNRRTSAEYLPAIHGSVKLIDDVVNGSKLNGIVAQRRRETEDPALVTRMESVELCATPVRLADSHSFTL
jgi:hypothetical protein